jgi:hypothetical protein
MPTNNAVQVNALGGLHCAYLKDTLAVNGSTGTGGSTMTCGDLLTALDPSNIAGAVYGMVGDGRDGSDTGGSGGGGSGSGGGGGGGGVVGGGK